MQPDYKTINQELKEDDLKHAQMIRDDNNKLIAEFMGGKLVVNEPPILLYQFYEDTYSIGELNYHSSWDWLHPVISKIYKIELPPVSDKWINFKVLIESMLTGDIKKAYSIVVEFLRWYELNK